MSGPDREGKVGCPSGPMEGEGSTRGDQTLVGVLCSHMKDIPHL